jgi:hypothetical protein
MSAAAGRPGTRTARVPRRASCRRTASGVNPVSRASLSSATSRTPEPWAVSRSRDTAPRFAAELQPLRGIIFILYRIAVRFTNVSPRSTADELGKSSFAPFLRLLVFHACASGHCVLRVYCSAPFLVPKIPPNPAAHGQRTQIELLIPPSEDTHEVSFWESAIEVTRRSV